MKHMFQAVNLSVILRGNNMNHSQKTPCSCIENHPAGFETPIRKLKRFQRNLRYSYQRIRYGYCESDVWSIDLWFLNVMPNMLDDLRKSAQSNASTQENQLLSEMAFLFREAQEETCSKKNPYKKARLRAQRDFEKMYGPWGEKLKIAAEIREEKKHNILISHTMEDVPKYQPIAAKYRVAEQKLSEYRTDCRNRGLKLFCEHFHELWD